MSGTPEPDPQERMLLERCLRGEADAWRTFVGRYHSTMEGAVRFTFLKCLYKVPENDVENVVQDLYARLYEDDFRRLRSYQSRCPLGAWLKSLAVRHTLNTIRDEKVRGRFGGPSLDDTPLQPEAGGVDVSAPAEEREAVHRLDALMDQLGPVQRAALKMFYYDGLTYRRIAAALGISTQSVGSIISRARDRLRDLLKGTEGKP